jgi:peptidyl-prolyl cis-trans isomerase SurA
MKHIFSFASFLFTVSLLSAQYSPDKELLSIDNYKVTAGEFEQVYTKNYNINSAEKQTVDEYFNLFLNFRLKVADALNAKMDTAKSFNDEFKTYRGQLAKTYLTDNSILENLIQEVYNRTKNEVGVSHIMIRLAANPTPADTLEAYKKISAIRKLILDGADFEKTARENSEDQSVQFNGGFLGYSRALRFPYSFETAMFTAKPGEVTLPIRTSYGYHLLKTTSVRPSKGELRVAHIMVAVSQNANDSVNQLAKHKIDSIYTLLKNGAEFKSLTKLSDDKSSVNGELPWFSAGRMLPEFEEAAFALSKPNEISAPVRTIAGFHIIKLLENKPVAAYADLKNELKNKIMTDERYQIVNKKYIADLKAKYAVKLYPEVLKSFEQLDSSVYSGKINIKNSEEAKPILTIQKQNYSTSTFVSYLKANPIDGKRTAIKTYIENSYTKFVDASVLQFEDSKLESKFPEFKSLVNEYYDGILLFNIMDSKVWSKAAKDTVGLQAFFKNNWSAKHPETKKLDEAKGLVTSDYQTFLEDQWIADLKKTYKVVVNRDLLTKIANKYKSK